VVHKQIKDALPTFEVGWYIYERKKYHPAYKSYDVTWGMVVVIGTKETLKKRSEVGDKITHSMLRKYEEKGRKACSMEP
jgi:hypothetical protein